MPWSAQEIICEVENGPLIGASSEFSSLYSHMTPLLLLISEVEGSLFAVVVSELDDGSDSVWKTWDLGSKWVRLAPKCDTSWIFSDRIQYILDQKREKRPREKNGLYSTENRHEKVPHLSHLVVICVNLRWNVPSLDVLSLGQVHSDMFPVFYY